MRIIARQTLKIFWTTHADAEASLRTWIHEAKTQRWKSYSDIARSFAHARLLPGNRVIFNLKGNTYRLIVKIHYNTGVVFIRFIGTHADYDRIDALAV